MAKAIFLLVGTIIGAGIFSLPYAFLLSGFWFSFFGLLALTAVTLTINLFYLRIISKTEGDHQLSGYGKIYLGQKGKWWGLLAILFSSWGALLAYIILGGDFLALLFGQPSLIWHRLLYWCWGGFFVWRGLKTITQAEEWLTFVLVVLAITIPVLALPFFRPENLAIAPSSPLAFYGPLLFALSGMGVIPEVEEVLRRKKELLVKTLIIGSLVPALVYFIFGFGILAVSGAATSADALSSLWAWSPALVRLGALVGFLSTFTSFLSLANVLKEVFLQDLSWSAKTAKSVALFSALPAIFFSLRHFLPIISLTGSVAIGSGSLLVLTIFYQRFAKSFLEKLHVVLLGLILLGGIGFHLATMLK